MSQSSPPHSLDAERAALGTVLLTPRAFVTLQDSVRADDFYSTAHRQIFAAMGELADRTHPIDLTTLGEALRRRNEIEAVGGPGYLASLTDYVFAPDNLPQYVATIRELSRLRQLIATAEHIQRQAHDSPRPVSEILNESEKMIFDLTQESESRDFVHVSDVAVEAIDQVNTHFHNRQEVAGLATGFSKLDQMLTGFHGSELIIIAARPSMGKSALGLNMAMHMALRESAPVGLFSLEMGNLELVQRLLCSMARVEMQKVRRGFLARPELDRLEENARRLSHAPIYLDDTPGLSSLELRARARRLKARVPDLAVIMVDYLQLMRGATKTESRQQEVSEISRSLKGLAKEMNIPVVAMSQLSRGIESRKGKDKTPKLSDLRESGAIEQDADVVMFVHRDRMPETDEQVRRPFETAQIVVGKQRNGPIGTINLLFFGDYVLFADPHPDSGL